MAQQRAFLLSQATAPYCMFPDDDVIIESGLLERMLRSLREQQCGFVGSASHGLSYRGEVRPHQQEIEFWHSQVTPEQVVPGSRAWVRQHRHRAAMSVRFSCPVCGQEIRSTRCPHDVCFVDDVPVGQVTSMALGLLRGSA